MNSKPLNVGFFVSSDGNRCFTPGLVTSIKYFAAKLVDQVNASGGIGGRKVALTFLDDFEQAETTVANVKEAINDPSMMAMIGVPSSTRGRAVFKALGPEIRAKAIPFITEMSLDNIFHDYPNVFTMASSVRNELEVVRKIIAAGGYGRPVFVGLDDDLYSFALGDGVKDIPGGPALAGSYQVPVRDYKLDPEASAPVVEQIKRQNPDLILLSIHSGPSATLLNQLTEAGIDAPVFVLMPLCLCC
jgi:ABC-type branched-subunit amino acid transport system substrate-binding protein